MTESCQADELLDLLYAEHAAPLLAYVQRLVGGDRLQAEDVVQETFPARVARRALLGLDVAEAFRTLGADHREVLIEVHFRERSIAAAARTLGMPEGAVESRTYYALHALRLALEERGVLEP